MWNYDKRLMYPVRVKKPDPMSASIIISQLGGPDGELGAATRYLQQRYSMPYGEIIGLLTDIGTEELAHVEMISALIYQLTRGMTEEVRLLFCRPYRRGLSPGGVRRPLLRRDAPGHRRHLRRPA